MQYSTIFTFPPWEHIGLAVLQTATIFWLVLVGLHVVGRRVFAQRGPQDLILIVFWSQKRATWALHLKRRGIGEP